MSAGGDRLPKAIFLMGPTASGKTDLALALADRLPIDIISVDSAMIYRDMNVGTAKPDASILHRYPHALVDILDPAQAWSVADFHREASNAMASSAARGRIPLLVGGTMMYFNALRYGLAPVPPSDPEVRARLEAEAQTAGLPALHERLVSMDPIAAEKIHPKNRQRLLRALEIIELSGLTPTALWRSATDFGLTSREHRPWHEENSVTLPYTVSQLVVAPTDRVVLHERIALRFQQMLKSGLVEEVDQLYRRGDLTTQMPSVRCVGYRQVWDYLAGETDAETMAERGVAATRQLAKRQFTWLRKWPEATWFDGSAPNVAELALKVIARGPIS